MLTNLDLTETVSKADYKRMLPDLHNRLYSLQKAAWDACIPVVVLIEGWESCGKGRVLKNLTAPLDPRGFHLHSIGAPSAQERMYPWMRRFWLRLPERSAWAIFDRSWYRRVLDERMHGEVVESEWRRAYRDIVDFERALVEDGYLIVKYFLHISKRVQQQRLDKRQDGKSASGRPSQAEWEQNHRYDEWVQAIEEMFAQTDTEWGTWTPVESVDKRYASLKIYRSLSRYLEDRLGMSAPQSVSRVAEPLPLPEPDPETEQAPEITLEPELQDQVEENLLGDTDAGG